MTNRQIQNKLKKMGVHISERYEFMVFRAIAQVFGRFKSIQRVLKSHKDRIQSHDLLMSKYEARIAEFEKRVERLEKELTDRKVAEAQEAIRNLEAEILAEENEPYRFGRYRGAIRVRVACTTTTMRHKPCTMRSTMARKTIRWLR